MKSEHILDGYDRAVCIMAIRAPEHAPASLKAAIAEAAKQAKELEPIDPEELKLQRQALREAKRLRKIEQKRRQQEALKPPKKLDESEEQFVPKGVKIKATAARKYGITVADMLSSRRWQYLVRARQDCWYMLYEVGFSLQQIGAMFGGKDHTTILHGIKKHAKREGLKVRKTVWSAKTEDQS